MWTAVKREVGLAIGFPDLNCGEDEYFGQRLDEYRRKFKKKVVLIEDMIPQHRHRSSLKGFIKVRWKYGQSAILLRFANKKFGFPVALIAFTVLSIVLIFVLKEFFSLYLLGLLAGFLLMKARLWRWILKNYGTKVMIGCLSLTCFGALVSLLSMYPGLIKVRKGIKIYRYSSVRA